MLVDVKGYAEKGVAICPNGTIGDHVEIGGLLIRSKNSIGERLIFPRSYRVFVLWMSGRRCPGSSERSFVHISKRSFGVGVRAFGFIIEVMLHTSRVGII